MIEQYLEKGKLHRSYDIPKMKAEIDNAQKELLSLKNERDVLQNEINTIEARITNRQLSMYKQISLDFFKECGYEILLKQNRDTFSIKIALMKHIRANSTLTFKQIGSIFGVDHSTALFHIRKEAGKFDPTLQFYIDKLQEFLK